MRKIKEVLQLKFDGKQSNRNIAVSCSISRSTVADYLLRAKAIGFSWPLPDDLSETALGHSSFVLLFVVPFVFRQSPRWPAMAPVP
jgi:hypothetical protein